MPEFAIEILQADLAIVYIHEKYTEMAIFIQNIINVKKNMQKMHYMWLFKSVNNMEIT